MSCRVLYIVIVDDLCSKATALCIRLLHYPIGLMETFPNSKNRLCIHVCTSKQQTYHTRSEILKEEMNVYSA